MEFDIVKAFYFFALARFNLSSFETWLRCQKFGDTRIMNCLQPMTEAVQLLQTALITENYAQIVCDMCDYLNTSQVKYLSFAL